MRERIKEHQDRVINAAKEIYSHAPLSTEVIEAYYAVPRHRFVKHFLDRATGKWVDLTHSNLEKYLEQIYDDEPLVIFGNENAPSATISQPSFVLKMIDLLQIKKGLNVFELGTGSGWNAAILGYLVGPSGKVVSLEIIPELIEQARRSIAALGLNQVEIYLGDGAEGFPKYAPYDRAIFTAGSATLPEAFFRQIKPGGLLLFVFRTAGDHDILMLLERKTDCFESIYLTPCGFVPMTGSHANRELKDVPIPLKELSKFKVKAHPDGRFEWLRKTQK